MIKMLKITFLEAPFLKTFMGANPLASQYRAPQKTILERSKCPYRSRSATEYTISKCKASNLIRQLLTDLIQPLVMPIEYVNNRGLSIGSVEDFEPAFLL